MRTLDLGEAVGPGVPTGGTANQVLVKNGATNFDTSWKDASQLPAIDDEAAAREAADAALADGLAIIANGDTHAAVAAGQAVFVRSHSTLAAGLYWASSAIGTNAALSTSNLTADSQGGLNKLKADLDSLNSKIAVKTINLTATVGHSSFTPSVCKFGNVVIGSIAIVTTEAVNDLASFITGFPAPRLNPQLPVWEYGNPSCNKRVCILASGEMQPWWNSSSGLPAGNYVIPIYYIASN